jgi:hypothetical protein
MAVLLSCVACSRSHGVDHGRDPDAAGDAGDTAGCEVLVDEVLTEHALSARRNIGIGPDGSVYAFFWDGESLIASRRAPEGGWSEQVLRGQSLDSTDFPEFRVAAGGRPEPTLLLVGSYDSTLWQLRDGVWETRWTDASLGGGSQTPIAVSTRGDAHYVLVSALDASASQLYVLPAGEDAPRIELTLAGVDPLLALDGEAWRHVLRRESTESARWLYQAPDGSLEEAFSAQRARPAFAVAGGQLAALYRDDEGFTRLATRGSAGWQSAALGSESGEECGEAWDRPTKGRSCLHSSHRYAAWALAGGPRLALVAFERDQEGERVADCTSPALGCVWADGAGFVDDSRLVFGTIGVAGLRLVELPVELPRGMAPSWHLALDQGADGTLHLLLPPADDWGPGPLRYVRVRCDDT